MAIDYTQLETEINTDPKSLGYAAHIGNDPAIAELLNTVGLSNETVAREAIPARDVMREVNVAEFEALSAGKQRMWGLMITAGAEQLEVSDANLVAQTLAIWEPATTTRANLVALATRSCSRAEKLFGTGIVISHSDVAKALRG